MIRRFQESDASQIQDIVYQALVEVNSQDYSKEVIENMVSKFTVDYLKRAAKKYAMFVYDDGDVQATGTIDMKGKQIKGVFVSPKKHGKGIGSQLMKHLEQYAKEHSLSYVDLRSSITAKTFYEKIGYECLEKLEDDFYGPGFLMRKQL